MKVQVTELLSAEFYHDERGFGYVLNDDAGYVDSAGGFRSRSEVKNAAIHMAQYFERHPKGFLN